MGKIIKVLSLIILIFVCSSLLFRFFVGEHQSTLYKIFETKTDGYYLYKFFGIIPKEIQERYLVEVLDSSGRSEVISLYDQSSPINTNFIILRSGSKERFIKAYPWTLFKEEFKNEINSKNYVSHLINLEVFNQYIEDYNITGRNEVERKYCYFLSIPDDTYSYRIVKKSADLDSIIAQFPLNNIEALVSSGYNILNLNSIVFEESEEMIYCWFINHGFVKFQFTFEGGKLIKVESTSLGYLGNEFPSCC